MLVEREREREGAYAHVRPTERVSRLAPITPNLETGNIDAKEMFPKHSAYSPIPHSRRDCSDRQTVKGGRRGRGGGSAG